MSAIPRPIARRIDRLARRAHAFHRFAHHPLCREYEGEVLRLGHKFRVCRGCALCAAGAIAGIALGLASPPAAALAAAALPIALLAAFARARAAGKLATRFLPSSLLAFAAMLGLRSGGAAGLAVLLASLASVAILVRAYRRRGPNRSHCAVCPERAGAVPCRGFAPIVRRERAFQRLASGMITN